MLCKKVYMHSLFRIPELSSCVVTALFFFDKPSLLALISFQARHCIIVVPFSQEYSPFYSMFCDFHYLIHFNLTELTYFSRWLTVNLDLVRLRPRSALLISRPVQKKKKE